MKNFENTKDFKLTGDVLSLVQAFDHHIWPWPSKTPLPFTVRWSIFAKVSHALVAAPSHADFELGAIIFPDT